MTFKHASGAHLTPRLSGGNGESRIQVVGIKAGKRVTPGGKEKTDLVIRATADGKTYTVRNAFDTALPASVGIGYKPPGSKIQNWYYPRVPGMLMITEMTADGWLDKRSHRGPTHRAGGALAIDVPLPKDLLK